MKILDFYNSEDSSDFENLPWLDIEWTLILQFCFLDDLKLRFLLDASIFTTIDKKKGGTKINYSNIFEGSYWGKLTLNNFNMYSKNWTP